MVPTDRGTAFMHSLEAIRRKAQADADREGRAVVILNLNRFSPLYVVREDWPGADADRAFVERVEPQATEA